MLAIAVASLPRTGHAQETPAPAGDVAVSGAVQESQDAAAAHGHEDAIAAGDLPYDLKGVGLTEKLGDPLPLDAEFLDSEGNQIRLGDYFDGERPVLINYVYHSCPMLCSIALEELNRTLQELTWLPGEEFEVLTISFAAEETPEIAAGARERHLRILGREGAENGWHFLTGNEESIRRVTEATGYGFKWVEENQDYAHPAAIVFASGKGTITRYIHGMVYPTSDVRKALVESSQGKIGSAIDQVLLYCYRYDPASNSYVIHATNLMRLAGGLTVLVLVVGLFLFWRRERRSQERVLTHRISNFPSTETTG